MVSRGVKTNTEDTHGLNLGHRNSTRCTSYHQNFCAEKVGQKARGTLLWILFVAYMCQDYFCDQLG